MKTPGSVEAQMGKKGTGLGKGKARAGGANQGKVSGAKKRYASHPRKKGQ